MRWKRAVGFTIVELLIVIVIISILASLTVVAFNSVQQRSRDTQRKADLNAVSKLLSIYKADKGNLIGAGSGCGLSGDGQGWMSHRSSMGGVGGYPRSVLDCLKDEGLLNKDIIDPSGCTDDITSSQCNAPPARAYLKMNCTESGNIYVYLMARLDTPTTLAKPADMDANCGYAGWFAGYGINYLVRIN